MKQNGNIYSVLNDNVISADDPIIASIKPSLVIYEVIRIIDGKCLFLENHLDRLGTSIKLANKKLDVNVSDIIKNIYKLIASNSLINGNIRLSICYQETGTYLLYHKIPHHYPSRNDYLNGVKAITYKTERNNPNAKILNPELREKINHLIENAKVWEALLINHKNQITEGSRSNLFAVKGNTVFTSPSREVLTGITRMIVIKLCKELSVNLTEKNINYKEINQYDSFFISGTSPKILTLRMIDDICFDVSSQIIMKISIEYDKMILKYIKNTRIPVV